MASLANCRLSVSASMAPRAAGRRRQPRGCQGTHLLDGRRRAQARTQRRSCSRREPSQSRRSGGSTEGGKAAGGSAEAVGQREEGGVEPAASKKPAAAPKQQAARRSKKLRLVELGDDELHSVLQFAGPLGLGGAALACKRLLALFKSLSAESKGTFDRWALAAACAGIAWNSLDRCMLISSDDDSFIALCEKTGRLRRCNISVMLRKLWEGESWARGRRDSAWGRAYHCKATDPGRGRQPT